MRPGRYDDGLEVQWRTNGGSNEKEERVCDCERVAMGPCRALNADFLAGSLLIIAACCSWTGAGYVTQYIFSHFGFDSPFVLTYSSCSFFSIYLVVWMARVHLIGNVTNPLFWSKARDEIFLFGENLPKSDDSNHLYRNIPGTQSEINSDEVSLTESTSDSSNILWIFGKPIPKSYTQIDIIKAALIISPLWMAANVFYNFSLMYTSIGSAMIINNSSSVFALLLAYVSGVEKITAGKISGIILSFIGVAFVTVNSRDGNGDDNHSFYGDLCGIVGAIGYGLYSTVLKLKVPQNDADETTVPNQLLFGYIGLINIIIFMPVIIIMIVLNISNIRSLTWTIFGFVILNCVFDGILGDYLWAKSVFLTSPTFATLGMSLTIPLAILCDIFVSHSTSDINPFTLIGAALVVGGFCIVNVDFGN